MPLQPFLLSLAICVVGAALEGALAGGGVKSRFAELRLPQYSPPLGVWIAIGGLYYIVCFFVLYRLISGGLTSALAMLAFLLLLAVMLFNAAWNYVFFRRKNLQASFLAFLPYAGLLLTLEAILLRTDVAAAATVLPYLAYLLYASWWAYRLWRLNES